MSEPEPVNNPHVSSVSDSWGNLSTGEFRDLDGGENANLILV